MARLSRTAVFEKTLKDAFGRNTTTTRKGYLGYEKYPGAFMSGLGNLNAAGYAAALRPDYQLRFMQPTRDHVIAYLVQEMIAVSSKLSRAIDRLASDASQDSAAASQPFTILVNEWNEAQRSKILNLCQNIVRQTRLGYKGRMRIWNALLTGDAIGQPIYEQVGGKWYLADVVLMPSWEMHFDAQTGIWRQFKALDPNRAIAEWKIPDFMARTIHDENDNYLYGKSILSQQVVNYRHYITALEDLTVAARTRAPRRLVHSLGPDNQSFRLDPEAIKAYQERVNSKPKSIVTDYYITKGFEEIKELAGDSTGVMALLEVVKHVEKRMLTDMGLPNDPAELRSRGNTESVDQAYAARINQLRQEDAPFVIDILRKGLLLEGYSDVDIDIGIPPLAETESIRWKRYSDAYHNSLISYDTWCAGAGIKDPLAERMKVQGDLKWKDNNGIPRFIAGNADEDMGTVGQPTESGKQGMDANKGRERREEIRKEGRTPTGK